MNGMKVNSSFNIFFSKNCTLSHLWLVCSCTFVSFVHSELWALLAKAYNRINEFENAAGAAEAALALDPYNPMTRKLILELNPDKWYYYLNEQDEAGLLLQRCLG